MGGSSGKQWYIISYDIRDSVRLRRVAKKMEGYGTRIQYSLFRCRLTRKELERLRWELSKITADEDDLLVIGLCSSCVSKIKSKNEDIEDWLEKPPGYEII